MARYLAERAETLRVSAMPAVRPAATFGRKGV
jgi:hypothetical protein